MGSPDAGCQNTLAPAMQVAISGTACVLLRPSRAEGRGNAGPVESVENQTAVSLDFHRPLEISQRRRDSHTSTASSLRRMEKWKTKSRFPTFPRGASDDDDGSGSQNQKPKKGSRPLRGLLTPLFRRSPTHPDFMLILRLENAGRPVPPARRGVAHAIRDIAIQLRVGRIA